jgi:hypothetical protein
MRCDRWYLLQEDQAQITKYLTEGIGKAESLTELRRPTMRVYAEMIRARAAHLAALADWKGVEQDTAKALELLGQVWHGACTAGH